MIVISDLRYYQITLIVKLTRAIISFALGGFLIAHTNKGLCLSTHKSGVVLRKCDETNPSQQWMWTSTMRLNHTLMSRCLWVNQSLAVPRHARLVKLSDCDTAPAWKCYDNQGTFGLAETPMFLRKQGVRVVARLEPKYSNWSMMTVASEGRRVSMSLCPTTGQPTVSPSHKCSHVSVHIWVDLAGVAIFIQSTRSKKCWVVGLYTNMD